MKLNLKYRGLPRKQKKKHTRILEEFALVVIATTHEDNGMAGRAMKQLRRRFNKTYFWCDDCDYAVTTKKGCCLNTGMGITDVEF